VLFLKDLIVLIARILIAIGDLVILMLSPIWKVLVWLFSNAGKSRIKEHEIYNADSLKPKISFEKPGLPQLSYKKPVLPTIKTPKFKLPKFRLPKPKLPQPQIPLPAFHFEHFLKTPLKKRGRRRKIIFFTPISTKVRYIIAGALISFLFIFLPVTSVIFLQNLPNPRSLATQEIAQTTKIYDRNHTLLYSIYANQNRTVVPLSQIPDNLKRATIAIEDKNFYSNPGVDFLAIARSAVGNAQNKPTQGGSTITQQLVRARLLTPERSFDRKIKEIVLSIWAQRIYSKNQILEMYLNQVPYGGTSWGVEAASQTYFGRDVKELDLAQSAFLAGLPQAPSVYTPYGQHPDSWKARQKDVLRRMKESGYITNKQMNEALAEKLTFQPEKHILHAPYFVMYVKDWLEREYGLPIVERGGLSVITSLDLKTQDMAQKTVTQEVDKAGHLNFTNGGALVTNPKNGDILAMVGGKNYYDQNGGNYNTTTALRQPGSTIKVITYAAALMNGFTAATVIPDTPITFNSAGSTPYSPVNYDGRFHGNVTLRLALANSINIPAVKTLNQVGIPTMMNLAKRMGVSTWGDPSQYGLALTLGAGEVRMTDMAEVYGTIANQGQKVDLNPILKVTDYSGNVLEEKEVTSTQVLPREVSYILSNILADNKARQMEFGSNSPLVIPNHTVSVKTGTTDNKRDNWTIGYTPNKLVSVWVGNNNNAPMNPVLASGITGAAPIWHNIMSTLLSGENQKEEIYAMPPDIVIKSCNGKDEYFVRGTELLGNCRALGINNQIPTRFRQR
jgi:1A family penicillin-binding protein